MLSGRPAQRLLEPGQPQHLYPPNRGDRQPTEGLARIMASQDGSYVQSEKN